MKTLFKNLINSKKKKAIIFGALPLIFALNILFIQATPSGSVNNPWSGYNSIVHREGEWVIKELVGTKTLSPKLAAETIFTLHNSLAEYMPDLIPRYEMVKDGVLRQPFVGEYSFEQLSPAAQINAETKMLDIIRRAESFAAKAWNVNGGKLSASEPISLPNGGYAMLDNLNNWGNFKFKSDGTPFKWFDPVAAIDPSDIGPEQFEGMKSAADSKLKTQLPIDNGEKLKIAEEPTATGARGLTSLKTFTFLSTAMAAAGVALIANDYKNQLNAATTSDQKYAAHFNFIISMGAVLGFSIGGAAVIALIAPSFPFIAAGATVGLVGLGAVGLGTHISATFNNDILAFWDKLANRQPTKIAADHPMYKTKIDYQQQSLQLQLKRMANTAGRAEVQFEDIARTSVLLDKSFNQRFYSPSTTAQSPYRSGVLLSDMRVKEMQLFDIYTDLSMGIGSKSKYTVDEMKSYSASLVKAAKLKNDLFTLQKSIGAAVYVPEDIEKKAIAKYERALTIQPIPEDNRLYIKLASARKTYSVPVPVVKGTLDLPIHGVAPVYFGSPIVYNGNPDLLDSTIQNDPGIEVQGGKKPGAKHWSITIVPETGPSKSFEGWYVPQPFAAADAGVVYERDSNTGALSPIPIMRPIVGAGTYDSLSNNTTVTYSPYYDQSPDSPVTPPTDDMPIDPPLPIGE